MEGRLLAGRYRLLSKLGQGGMGSVWRAEHTTLRTQVAIKLIDPAKAESREALGRFQREAQASAELRSTHIVQIIDYGVDGDTPFIAMELLEGESLRQRLERFGKIVPNQTAYFLTQVARALGRAHAKGVIHRDLKPDNIFLALEGQQEVAKVLDFGVAKKLDDLSISSGVKTHTGALIGTPYYMSPEQALGQADIDCRSDIWSLGIIAYECLTGSRPFSKNTLGALIMAICQEPMPIPSRHSTVPCGFDAWFARATARDRVERFGTADEAADELRTICSSSDLESSRITPLSPPTAVLPRGSSALLVTTTRSVVSLLTAEHVGSGHRRSIFALSATIFIAIALYYWSSSRPQPSFSVPAATNGVAVQTVVSAQSAPMVVEVSKAAADFSANPQTKPEARTLGKQAGKVGAKTATQRSSLAASPNQARAEAVSATIKGSVMLPVSAQSSPSAEPKREAATSADEFVGF